MVCLYIYIYIYIYIYKQTNMTKHITTLLRICTQGNKYMYILNNANMQVHIHVMQLSKRPNQGF